jgi:hypothetical protein
MSTFAAPLTSVTVIELDLPSQSATEAEIGTGRFVLDD